ncbi:unnamed protein product, partial [Amoebophrya sp. A25]
THVYRPTDLTAVAKSSAILRDCIESRHQYNCRQQKIRAGSTVSAVEDDAKETTTSTKANKRTCTICPSCNVEQRLVDVSDPRILETGETFPYQWKADLRGRASFSVIVSMNVPLCRLLTRMGLDGALRAV